MITENNKDKAKLIIKILAVVIPVLVGLLVGIRQKIDLGEWTMLLPHFNGFLNSLTSVLLIVALIAIKNKNIKLHERLMTSSFIIGGVFLLTYVLYHISNESTPFGGIGSIKYTYYFFLISHVLLSFAVVPLVLYAIMYAWLKDFDNHKRLVKFAYPIWLYVSVTGVIVYLMISPYYK